MLPAGVARPVPKKKVLLKPILPCGSFKEAAEKEGDPLRNKGVLNKATVQTWEDVARKARHEKHVLHMGRILGIIVGENCELDTDDKSREFRYRVALQGNNVCTQDDESATSQDLGSAKAFIVMVVSLAMKQNRHAEQTYFKAQLTRKETWVSIPKEAWPSGRWIYPDGVCPDAPDAEAVGIPMWGRPVCRLERGLYGHPDACTMWEKHHHSKSFLNGLTSVTSWASCYHDSKLRVVLMVRIEDFKLAGLAGTLECGWELISDGLSGNRPGGVGSYSGCKNECEESHRQRSSCFALAYNMDEDFTPIVQNLDELST